jgi:hypothetical protein
MDFSRSPASAFGVHLFRVDYGYPDAQPMWASGWDVWDLSRFPRSPNPKTGLLFEMGGASASGRIFRNADRLLAWVRLRGKGDAVGEVCKAAASRPMVLQCRFPRHATALRRTLEEAQVLASFDETPRDGSLPPLYRKLDPEDPLTLLHLELEWGSALACARGDVALEQVGLLLASGPRRGSTIAAALGITQGAARSYLQWMEDVALVRREGRQFELAHPLLRQRFRGDFKPAKWLHPPRPRREDEMSVD